MLSPDAEWRVLQHDAAWRRRALVAVAALALYGLWLLALRRGVVLERALLSAAALRHYGPGGGRYAGAWHASGVLSVSAGLRYLLVSASLLLLVAFGGPMRPAWQAARLAGIALGVAGAVAVAAWLGV